jgi:flagellar protein FlbB
MKISPRCAFFVSAFLLVLFPLPTVFDNGDCGGNRDCEAAAGQVQKTAVRRSPAPPSAGDNYGSREQMEKETALHLKEQELKKMSANLDARMKALEDKRKSLETSLSAGNKVNDERYKKMIKLYKSLQPEEAAGLIGKLDEGTAFEMLNRMDTKTAAKLIPYLNQKMVLKWTRLSLKGE